ncbi:MAG: PulJ/GspJ family protein [Cellulosilyticaceae bacterium]
MDKEKGFTLIEVIISIAIFGLVVILMVSMLQANIAITTKGRSIAEGSQKNNNDFIVGVTTESEPVNFNIVFDTGKTTKTIEVEGVYIHTASPSDTYADLYQKFQATDFK